MHCCVDLIALLIIELLTNNTFGTFWGGSSLSTLDKNLALQSETSPCDASPVLLLGYTIFVFVVNKVTSHVHILYIPNCHDNFAKKATMRNLEILNDPHITGDIIMCCDLVK